MEQAKLVDGLRIEREALTAFLEGLDEARFGEPSLCAGWSVGDVLRHLVGNAKDVADFNLEGAGTEAYNQRQIDERANKSKAELLEEYRKEGPRLEEAGAAFSPEQWDSPFPPFGTIATASARLLEDLWIHAHDIRIPLGEAPTVLGPGLDGTVEAVAFELEQRLPERSPGTGRVEIATGPHERTVEVGDGATVRITGDPVTFGLAATGRITLAEATADGKLSLSEVPEGFASAFNIYAP